MPKETNSKQPKISHVERRKRINRLRRNFFLMSFVFILILAGIITAIIEIPKMNDEQSETTTQDQTEEALPEQNQNVQGVIGPIEGEVSYTVPTAAMMAQSEHSRVDMSYFSDAVFVGDSLTLGFQTYASGIVNTNYAAYTGIGPRNIMEGSVTNVNGELVVAIDEILAASPKKVYVQLGMNVLSSIDDEAFLLYYENLIVFLKEKLPADTVFYLQSLTPVTNEKSTTEEEYSNERIRNLNESLAKLAYDYNWCYLDLYSVLSDANGDLNEEIVAGSDGVHLNNSGYSLWREYLIKHTSYNSANPYIGGTPLIS